ncbi:MAG: hypothetical protein MUD01_14870 [Chloroflexaceae bacterium]|nr:hypothetical protein [Chloroflexaceae bacterium]
MASGLIAQSVAERELVCNWGAGLLVPPHIMEETGTHSSLVTRTHSSLVTRHSSLVTRHSSLAHRRTNGR